MNSTACTRRRKNLSPTHDQKEIARDGRAVAASCKRYENSCENTGTGGGFGRRTRAAFGDLLGVRVFSTRLVHASKVRVQHESQNLAFRLALSRCTVVACKCLACFMPLRTRYSIGYCVVCFQGKPRLINFERGFSLRLRAVSPKVLSVEQVSRSAKDLKLGLLAREVIEQAWNPNVFGCWGFFL